MTVQRIPLEKALGVLYVFSFFDLDEHVREAVV
jgi:hypothetical protein